MLVIWRVTIVFNRRDESRVLIAGGGPAGLFAAHRCASARVPTRILDEKWRLTQQAAPVLLDASALELLSETGLAEEIVASSRRIDGITFYEGPQKRTHVDLALASSKYPFAATLTRGKFQIALGSALEVQGQHVEWGHRLSAIEQDGNVLKATVDRLGRDSVGYAVSETETIVEKSTNCAPPFVVGAEGKRSVVRMQLDLNFDEPLRKDVYALVDMESGSEDHPEIGVVFDGDRTHVYWPLPDGRCRWALQLAPQEEGYETSYYPDGVERVAPLPETSVDSLNDLLSAAAPWFSGRIRPEEAVEPARFETRVASALGHGRAWLVGDSAHTAGPADLAVATIGLAEGAELAELLGKMAGDANMNAEEAFAELSARRVREWCELVGAVSPPEPDSSADPWVREHASRILRAIPARGKGRAALLKQLGF